MPALNNKKEKIEVIPRTYQENPNYTRAITAGTDLNSVLSLNLTQTSRVEKPIIPKYYLSRIF